MSFNRKLPSASELIDYAQWFLGDEFGSPASSDDSTPMPSKSGKKPKKGKKQKKGIEKKPAVSQIQKDPSNKNPSTLGR